MKATKIASRRISASRIQASRMGSSGSDRPGIVYIGDSNTNYGFLARIHDGSPLAIRSDSSTLVDGECIFTAYSNGNMQFQAPGDTVGPITSGGGKGFIYLQSGSTDKWVGINIPQYVIDSAPPEGASIPIPIPAISENHGFSDVSPSTYAQILSGQKFSKYANLGAVGETADGLLARIDQIFGVDSFGRSFQRPPCVAVVMIGINNYIGAEPEDEAAATNASLTGIKNAIHAMGGRVVFCTLAAENPDASLSTYINAVNSHITNMASTEPRVRVADIHASCNGDSSLMGGLHFYPAGALAAGALIAAHLDQIATHGKGLGDFRLGGRSDNRVTNGKLAGTAGAITNITGSTADNTSSIYSGSGACVASKVAEAGNYDWQRYTITGASAGDTLTVELDFTAVVGEYLYSEAEISITGDGVISASHALMFADAGETLTDNCHSCGNLSSNTSTIGTFGGVLRTRDIDVPPWASSTKLVVTIELAAGDTVINMRNIGAAETGRHHGI